MTCKVVVVLVELNKLGELIKSRFLDNEEGYRYYWHGIREQFGDEPYPEGPCWVLMLRDVLPGSRGIYHLTPEAKMAINYNTEGYSIPHTLEATTGILTHYARTGERLFPDDPATYARCSDLLVHDVRKWPPVVGGFSSSGLAVDDNIDIDILGTHSRFLFCRKF